MVLSNLIKTGHIDSDGDIVQFISSEEFKKMSIQLPLREIDSRVEKSYEKLSFEQKLNEIDHGEKAMKDIEMKKKHEMVTLIPRQLESTPESRIHGGQVTNFVRELKTAYESLYNGILPVPFVRDKRKSVHEVFVESGIQTKGKSWQRIETHHNIFNDAHKKYKRRIIIGDPGYGKSILAIQLAYDWCKGIKESYLNTVEILLFLRLRQLNSVNSIYAAVKRFILSANTEFNETDIKCLVQNSHSVVIILDGFDEYPQRDENTSDITDILLGRLFQEFQVVLTTRYLPKLLDKEPKLLYMTGFDEKARVSYIRKAVVPDGDDREEENLNRSLRKNPVIWDLCEVPLFFSMFAHLIHESEQITSYQTVTDIFRFVVKCLHSHMANKMRDENVQTHYLYDHRHHKLDKIAFEALQSNNTALSKEDVVQRIGHEFYLCYLQTGILVEEYENCDSVDKTGSNEGQTKVRFQHKIFCEWYAAHYVSRYAVKCNVQELSEVLECFSLWDNEYLFRFACGLNRDAFDKIITIVQKKTDGENFENVCVLEQLRRDKTILPKVRDMCKRVIEIKMEQPRGLKRYTAQLLYIASKNAVSISNSNSTHCKVMQLLRVCLSEVA
ncbi:Protein NLRC5 [Holothuria leucospilota]|uniref:Protein NLRC5 n=1 Tax=Holothuria leucospilota TaxID=206669 RepID=A0A9Q0YEB9_HOLLE|nr:Protein NLRC5 [Holothuria leucospilota]